MTEMYRTPFKVFAEKVPFLEYIVRLIMYLAKPDIKEDEMNKNPLRYALADVFLSVGFISAITAYLVIFRPKYKYLSIIKAINPEPIIMNFLLGGFVTSTAFCIMAVLLIMRRTKIDSGIIKKKGYYLWLHCLRFYAVIILIIYTIFLHVAGIAVNEGKTLQDHTAEHLIAYWLVIVICVFLLFRLFINPVRRYLSISQSRLLSSFIILIVFILSIFANRAWSSINFGSIIDEKRCREVFQETDVYNCIPVDKRRDAEDLLCGSKMVHNKPLQQMQ